jgi:hypothetical protein
VLFDPSPPLGPQVARLSRFESPAVQRPPINITNAPAILQAEFHRLGTSDSMLGLPYQMPKNRSPAVRHTRTHLHTLWLKYPTLFDLPTVLFAKYIDWRGKRDYDAYPLKAKNSQVVPLVLSTFCLVIELRYTWFYLLRRKTRIRTSRQYEIIEASIPGHHHPVAVFSAGYFYKGFTPRLLH